MRRRLLPLLSLIFFTTCSKSKTDPATVGFVLPYAIGDSYECIQGNGGSFSHTGNFYYSWDFEMPIGTMITAAREGTVIMTEQQYTDGNATPGQENYVIIQHADASYGRYFHLTHNGVLVNAGTKVNKGTPIGLSGNTGFSSLPHLHFDVTYNCAIPAPNCPTKMIGFINAMDRVPVGGRVYTALNY